MSEEDKAEVARHRARPPSSRTATAAACCRRRPARRLIREMMASSSASRSTSDVVPMMLEEMELDGADAGAITWVDASPTTCSGRAPRRRHRLRRVGPARRHPARARPASRSPIIEKNAGLGGTWWENRYPGRRVDVGNHFYCYSFEPSDHWTEFFAQQPELRAYFARRHGPARHRAAHPLEHRGRRRATWDDDAGRWAVDVARRRRQRPRRSTRARVISRGRPAQPPEPARHPRHATTSPARRSTPRAGTTPSTHRASASRIDRRRRERLPDRADHRADVAHAHRVPAHRAVDVPEPELPRAGRPRRALGAAAPAVLRPLVPLPVLLAGLRRRASSRTHRPRLARRRPRAVSATNDIDPRVVHRLDHRQVGDDPELLAKVIPDYPATGKRTLQDNGSWLRALRKRQRRARPRRASTTSTPTASSPPTARCTRSTSSCYATGFRHNELPWPMEIVGRDGAVLREQWGDEPSAYLGITVPNFPTSSACTGRARTSPTAAA